MKKLISLFLMTFVLAFAGCQSVNDRLPSEDIEIFAKYSHIIRVLKSPRIPPFSKEKYEAAKELLRHVDLHFTRETATVNKIFSYRDAQVDGENTDTPVFTFNYQYLNKSVRIRFFTYKMFVTRVEIVEE